MVALAFGHTVLVGLVLGIILLVLLLFLLFFLMMRQPPRSTLFPSTTLFRSTETLVIVAIVIFLFLGSLRSVLVPLVAIPVSLIGAVFLMQLFGFTLNLLTLLAIVLAVGLVVDDAIVVVENIERHVREGKTPVDAALLGARELVG